MGFDVEEFRSHFPALDQKINNNKFIYFDNAASTLKHKAVCDRVYKYDLYETSNVHRGAHTLSRNGTENYEKARERVRSFIGASSPEEVVFVRGTTEGVNLVARSLASTFDPGDEILLSPFEHHSNIVCWQMLCHEKSLNLKIMDFDPVKGIDIEKLASSFGDKTKLCSFLWYSNSFGHRLPIEKIIEICKDRNTYSFIDAAQVPLHEKMDVKKIECDFLTFSGHKMFAPYGIGVLYGRKDKLQTMEPYQAGGSMIDRVSYEETHYADLPQKFEAGTPNISGAIGLGEAVALIEKQNFEQWHDHIQQMRSTIINGLKAIDGVIVYEFPAESCTGVISFNIKDVHSSDVGSILDQYGIAVRAGHHCTQPLMQAMGIEGTVRISLAPYNTMEEAEKFCEIMKKVKEFF